MGRWAALHVKVRDRGKSEREREREMDTLEPLFKVVSAGETRSG